MRTKIGLGLTLACLIGAPLCAQDTEARPSDPKERLKAALEKTAGFSGLKIEGAVAPLSTSTDRPARGLEGMMKGVLTSGGDIDLTFESETSTVEIYKIGSKTVTRTTTVNEAPVEGETPARRPDGGGGRGGFGMGDVRRELGQILNLKNAATQVAGVDKVEDKGSESVGGKTCTLLLAKITPPKPEAPADAPPDGEGRRRPGGMRGQTGGVRAITARFWVDDAEGVVRKLAYDIERGPSDEMIERMKERADRRPPRDEDPDAPPPPDDGGGRRMPSLEDMIQTSCYEIEFMEFLTDAKVTVPEELQKHFK